MRALVCRNILIFIKDKTAVFFSFMAVFVVFFLYLCFLKQAMIDSLMAAFPDTAEEICNCWIMAGTLGIITLTTSLSVLGILIKDKEKQILDDFQIAPISTFRLSVSYILSTVLITFVIACFTLAISQAYIVLQGGAYFSFIAYGKILFVLLLAITSCTCLLYVCLSFFNSDASFSNVTTIIGTLSGFLMGIYVPIGSLPMFLQHAIRFFYPSHGAALLRQIMMEDVMERTFFDAQMKDVFEEQFGLIFQYGKHLCTSYESMMILFGFGILFFFLAILRMHKLRG